MQKLRLAIGFLTIIPMGKVPFAGSKDLVAAAPLFPVAGAVLGGLLAFIAWSAGFGLPPGPTAAAIVAFEFILTRGLHMDGLADTADGFFGGFNRERILAIMKDSAIGPMGASAIGLVILFKYAALQAVAGKSLPLWILMMCISGRWSMVLAGTVAASARNEGLGSLLIDGLSWRHFLLASLAGATVLVISAFVSRMIGLPLLAGALLALLTGVTMAAISSRLLGGMTGDVLGAVNELAEAGFLLGALLGQGVVI